MELCGHNVVNNTMKVQYSNYLVTIHLVSRVDQKTTPLSCSWLEFGLGLHFFPLQQWYPPEWSILCIGITFENALFTGCSSPILGMCFHQHASQGSFKFFQCKGRRLNSGTNSATKSFLYYPSEEPHSAWTLDLV